MMRLDRDHRPLHPRPARRGIDDEIPKLDRVARAFETTGCRQVIRLIRNRPFEEALLSI
jgi:hypothetical protein